MGKPFTVRCDLIGRTCRVEISMAAEYCGLNRLSIEDVILRDSLGLITYRSDIIPESGAAAVLPDIVEYMGPEVLPSALPSDNDEEAEEGSVSGGFPGYEHRGYEPGDPLNRINYKLSAKKRTLMVRRDENTSAQSTDIVIAPGSDDTCMEQALALAKLHSLQALFRAYPDAAFVTQKEDVSIENNILYYRVVYTIVANICAE